MGIHKYDIVFLNFSIPLETRYNTLGELVNLVYNLDELGIKTAICIIPAINLDLDKFSKQKKNLKQIIWNSLSSHQIIENLIRKLLFKYSDKYLKNVDILKIKNFEDLRKVDTRYIASWL